MDIPRANVRHPLWKHRKILIGAVALLLLGIVVASLTANPSGMRVEAASVSISTVQRGPLIVTVQGSGVLRAQDVQLISAQTEARVERVLAHSGTEVKAGALLVQLTNPALNRAADESRWGLQQAEAELNALRTQLDIEQLNQNASIAKAVYADESARLQVEAEAGLYESHIVSRLAFERSKLHLKELDETLKLERVRLVKGHANIQSQLAARQAAVSRQKAVLQRAEDQVAALSVRAPIDATVEEFNLQPGQAVLPGTSLIKLANPQNLYAELQIPESQGRDLAIGQKAQVNFRSTTIEAQVMRVAPTVSNGTVRVELRLVGTLPRGLRPDLSIDGTIEVAHIDDALMVGRPVFSQPDSPASVYRVDKNNVAQRVNVEFGTAAVSSIVIKNGLQLGDRIVVSDTTSWRAHDRVKIR